MRLAGIFQVGGTFRRQLKATPGPLICLLLTAAALSILISRRPDQWVSPQLWAEDGFVFFSDAETLGWASLWKPYAGYLHMVPRLIACIGRMFSWELLPLIYSFAAALVATAVVVRVALARLPRRESLCGAVAMLAVPHSGEVFLNITNLHWILGFILVVNLLEPPPGSPGLALARCAELLLSGLSGPIVLFIAPLAIFWGWHWRRARFSQWLLVAWCIAFSAQLVVFKISARPVPLDVYSALGELRWVLPHYAAALLVGKWHFYEVWLGSLLAVLVGAILISGMGYSRGSHRGRILTLILSAGVILMGGRLGTSLWGNPSGEGARYTYMSLVLVMWCLGCIAAGPRFRYLQAIAFTLFVSAIITAAPNWAPPPLPDLNWRGQVDAARNGRRTFFEVAPGISFPVPRRESEFGNGRYDRGE